MFVKVVFVLYYSVFQRLYNYLRQLPATIYVFVTESRVTMSNGFETQRVIARTAWCRQRIFLAFARGRTRRGGGCERRRVDDVSDTSDSTDFARWFVCLGQLFSLGIRPVVVIAGLKIPGAIRFGWHEHVPRRECGPPYVTPEDCTRPAKVSHLGTRVSDPQATFPDTILTLIRFLFVSGILGLLLFLSLPRSFCRSLMNLNLILGRHRFCFGLLLLSS